MENKGYLANNAILLTTNFTKQLNYNPTWKNFNQLNCEYP